MVVKMAIVASNIKNKKAGSVKLKLSSDMITEVLRGTPSVFTIEFQVFSMTNRIRVSVPSGRKTTNRTYHYNDIEVTFMGQKVNAPLINNVSDLDMFLKSDDGDHGDRGDHDDQGDNGDNGDNGSYHGSDHGSGDEGDHGNGDEGDHSNGDEGDQEGNEEMPMFTYTGTLDDITSAIIEFDFPKLTKDMTIRYTGELKVLIAGIRITQKESTETADNTLEVVEVNEHPSRDYNH